MIGRYSNQYLRTTKRRITKNKAYPLYKILTLKILTRPWEEGRRSINGVADIPNNIVYTVQGYTKYRIRTKIQHY